MLDLPHSACRNIYALKAVTCYSRPDEPIETRIIFISREVSGLPVTTIQSPKGIRFECSGCADCCLHWPVPLTAEDYERISGRLEDCPACLQSLSSRRANLINFSATLEKLAGGSCKFLTAEKRCSIHMDSGASEKPSICRLFPYAFTVTPDAVLASVSFASTAVLHNTGRLLSEQPEALLLHYQLFESLFNPAAQSWQKLQLVDGIALDWERFRQIDSRLLSVIEADCPDPACVPIDVAARLMLASTQVINELADRSAVEKEPRLESRPRIVDQILLKHLERLYFPQEVFRQTSYDLNVAELLQELVAAPPAVSFGQAPESQRFAALIKIKLGKLPQQSEDLLNRFLYTRFFSKLFFGPGFHHLSLLSGIHHLSTLNVLLKLKLKQALAKDPQTQPSFELLCELLRTMERRLTQLDLSGRSLALLEVLLSSRARQERLAFLAE
jgi:Fe-S-cluster containining protein